MTCPHLLQVFLPECHVLKEPHPGHPPSIALALPDLFALASTPSVTLNTSHILQKLCVIDCLVTPALLAAGMKTPGGQEHAFDLIFDEPQVLMLCDNTGLGCEQDGLGSSMLSSRLVDWWWALRD